MYIITVHIYIFKSRVLGAASERGKIGGSVSRLTLLRVELRLWPNDPGHGCSGGWIGAKGPRMGYVLVDGQEVDIPTRPRSPALEAYPAVRDEVLRTGRIVTSVQIGGVPVTWDDGSERWDLPLSEENRLAVTTDYPIRMTSSLLDRVVEAMPQIAEEHRRQAEDIRAQGRASADATARLLSIWPEIQQVFEQVCVLHEIDPESSEWRGAAEQFRDLGRKLNESLAELREALDLGDAVLAADILDFELAPLAQEWTAPFESFRSSLEQRFGVESAVYEE